MYINQLYEVIFTSQNWWYYIMVNKFWCLCFWRDCCQWARTSLFTRFLDHTHNDAPQSVGLLWTIDQLVAESSTWQHTTLTIDKHPWPKQDSNPQSQQVSGRRLTSWNARPLGSAVNFLTKEICMAFNEHIVGVWRGNVCHMHSAWFGIMLVCLCAHVIYRMCNEFRGNKTEKTCTICRYS
jgi:hypothetical protein